MTTVTTHTSPSPSFGMPVLAFAPNQLIPESLIVQCSTKLGVVEGDEPAVYVPFIDLESDVGFVAEGADTPIADPDLSQVIIHTGKLSVLVKASREQLLQEGISAAVQDEIKRAMQARADWAFLNQVAPTPPATNPPAGILNQTNTISGTAITDNLDPLIDAVAAVTYTGTPPSSVIVSPNSWAELSKLKVGTDRNDSLLGAGTQGVDKSLVGVPAVITPEMADNMTVVLNKLRVISAYGNVEVATSNDYFFGSDNVAVRATFRFGVVVAKLAAAVKVATP